MLFFQHPEAEALLAADDWALMRQLLGKNSSEAKVQDYIDALSQPGAFVEGCAAAAAALHGSRCLPAMLVVKLVVTSCM